MSTVLDKMETKSLEGGQSGAVELIEETDEHRRLAVEHQIDRERCQ